MGKQAPGKRAGSRRATPKKARIDPVLLGLALAITVLVVAWGYLVKAAIDFGSDARDGNGGAWLFLAVACVGAAGCLFIGLILVAKLLALVGILPETATGPADAELGPQTARETPSAYVPTTDGYGDTSAGRPLRPFAPEGSGTTPGRGRGFAPPTPREQQPSANETTGSHAAIGADEDDSTRPPNPRYPGGKRAAR